MAKTNRKNIIVTKDFCPNCGHDRMWDKTLCCSRCGRLRETFIKKEIK